MDKNFCRQIDHESMVEQYVAGKLRGELLKKFEQHLKDCEDHAQAVLLEEAFKRGISEFARGEIKSNLKNRLKKREDTRFLILRYAAILFVAVITPLLLYYQLNVAPEEMVKSIADREEKISDNATTKEYEEDLPETEEPPKTGLSSRSSDSGIEEEKLVEPTTSAGSAYKKPQANTNEPEKVRQLKVTNKRRAESEEMQDMVKTVKASPPPKIKADHISEEENHSLQGDSPAMAIQGYSEEKESIFLLEEINKKIKEDSLSIKKCIEDFIDDSDYQKYLLGLNIQVLNDGKIGDLKIIKTTIKSSELESCLFNIIRSWTISANMSEGTVYQEITY